MAYRAKILVVTLAVFAAGLATATAWILISPNDALTTDELVANGVSADGKQLVLTDMQDCGITDRSLREIVGRYPGLEKVWLTQCPQITNQSFTEISRLQNLRILGIQGGVTLHEVGLEHLQKLRNLEKLTYTGVSITTVGASLLAKIKSLKVLVVSKGFISEDALELLQTQRPDLHLRLY